jgi:hypothetical protein
MPLTPWWSKSCREEGQAGSQEHFGTTKVFGMKTPLRNQEAVVLSKKRKDTCGNLILSDI